ncbi:hypothetical protein F5X99DRAFT_395306 [Biscogniauxia marginata]|nr:hypothetical protein F5X99DRAFT_395306 [Biscogniauxia marginata]
MAEDPAARGFLREADTADKLETLLVLGECPKSDLGAALPLTVGNGSLSLEGEIRNHYQQNRNPSTLKPLLVSQTPTSSHDQVQRRLEEEELPGDKQERKEKDSSPIDMDVDTNTGIESDTNSIDNQSIETDDDREDFDSESQASEGKSKESEGEPEESYQESETQNMMVRDLTSDYRDKCDLDSASTELVVDTGNDEDVTLEVETPDNADYTIDDVDGVAIDVIDFLDKSEFHSEPRDEYQDERKSTEGFWKKLSFRVW